MSIEAIKQMVAAIETDLRLFNIPATAKMLEALSIGHQAIAEAEKQEPKPVQVSPLEFVEMVMEKEHLVGKPIFWAEWPNKEKNA